MRKFIAIAVLLVATVALADKTITILSAPSKVVRMEFYPLAGGNVKATVCGNSQYSGGAPTAVSCYDIVLPPAHAVATSVNNLAAGDALTFWKGQEGL